MPPKAPNIATISNLVITSPRIRQARKATKKGVVFNIMKYMLNGTYSIAVTKNMKHNVPLIERIARMIEFFASIFSVKL